MPKRVEWAPPPRSPWAGVNRCLVCGSKLKFAPNASPKGTDEQGVKSCSHNHRRFSVEGQYDSSGQWQLTFIMPDPGKR